MLSRECEGSYNQRWLDTNSPPIPDARHTKEKGAMWETGARDRQEIEIGMHMHTHVHTHTVAT